MSETITYPSGTTLGYQYSHSLAGKKTRLTWPDGTPIDYGYSAHGELETVTIPGEGSISVSEYGWLAPKKTLLPGGGVQNRSFDGLLNLENLSTKTPSQQTTLNLDNRFGKLQELKQRSRTDTGNNLSTTKTEQFSFDADNRLTQVQTDSGGLFGSDTERYTLDAVSNRIAYSKVSGAWQYDANNRLTQIGTGSCGQSGVTCYQYDSVGNLTQKQTTTRTIQYRYDTQNRLIQVQDGSGQLIARYGYDPLDRRLWKEQFRDKDGQLLTQALRTHYLYADEGLIAEATQAITLNEDGSITASADPQITTQYGPKPESQFTTGMLFIKTRNSNGQDTVAYYHHDHLETPIQATDKAGNIVWAASYEAFGKASIITPQATADKPTITSNLRLPGQYEDAETGLHYNFRRYYDPETGRYTQSDPIGLLGGINTYAYVNGNPVGFVDPLGLAPGDKDFGIKDPGFWKWWEQNKREYGPFDKSHPGFNPRKPFDLPNRDMAKTMQDEYEQCRSRDSGRGGKTRGKTNINDLLRGSGRGGGRGGSEE